MATYKIRIHDRDCSKFEVVEAYSLRIVPCPKNLNPIKEKLCNEDIFQLTDNNVKILHSSA